MSRPDLGRAAVAVGALTMLGNGLGLVRDMVLAAVYGAGGHTDAFVVAWTVPETFSPLLMEGLVPLVLVPWLVRHATDRDAARTALASVWWVVLSGGLVLGAAVAGFAPLIVRLVAPGIPDAGLAATCVALAAGTVPAMTLAGLLAALLRSMGALVLPALVYAGYNVGILATTLLLQARFGILAAAAGLSVGALLMVLVQLPTAIRLVGLPAVSRLPVHRMGAALAVCVPTLGYLLARQGQVFVERQVGSRLDEGTITYLNLAQKLGQVPVTLVMALALVAFPAISRLVHRRDLAGVSRLTTAVTGAVTALLVPAAAFLMVTAVPLVTLAFGRGRFSDEAVQQTAATLTVYVAGLLAQGVVNVTVLTLFASSRRSWLPGVVLAAALTVTALTAVALAGPWGAPGIAAGNAAGITVAAVLLAARLRARGLLRWGPLIGTLGRAAALATLGALGTTVLVQGLSGSLAGLGTALGPLLHLLLAVGAFAGAALLVNVVTGGALVGDLGAVRRRTPTTASEGG